MAARERDNYTLTDFFEQFHDYMERYRNTNGGSSPSHTNDKLLHAMVNDIRYALNVTHDATDSPQQVTWDYSYSDWTDMYDDGYRKYMSLRPIILCAILAILILVGVIGNIVVIMTTLRHNNRVTSASNAFIINLCATNALFLAFCIPLVIYENVFMQSWVLGEAMCQLQRYIQYCCFYATTYALVLVVACTLLQITAPRRLAAVNNAAAASALCIAIWGVIMVGNIPNLLGHGLYDQIEGMTFCFHEALHGDWAKARRFIILQFTFSYALPFVAMAMMSLYLLYHLLCRAGDSNYGNIDDNARFQRSSVTMNVTLTLLFALCWSPDRILSLVLAYNPYIYGTYLFVISDLFVLLACCNATANPWIILFVLRHTLSASLPLEDDHVTPGGAHSTHRAGNRAINGRVKRTTNLDADTNQLTEYLEMNSGDQPENAMVQNL